MATCRPLLSGSGRPACSRLLTSVFRPPDTEAECPWAVFIFLTEGNCFRVPASEPNKGKQMADWQGRPPFARGLTLFADLTGPVVLSSAAHGAQPSW